MLDSLGKKIGKLYSLNGDKPNKAYLKNIVVYEKKTPGPEPIPPKTNDYLYKLLDIDSNGVVSQYTGEIPADYYSGIMYFDDYAAMNLYVNNDGLTGKLYFPDLEHIGQGSFANAYTDTGAELYFPKLNDVYQDAGPTGIGLAFDGVKTICHFNAGMQETIGIVPELYGLSPSQCVFDL